MSHIPSTLVVDDDEAFRDDMIEYIRACGWRAEGAEDGERGQELLATTAFDGMILDQAMPRKSGLELLRWARTQRRLNNLCILGLTAYGTDLNELECVRLGMWKYLRKPKRPSELFAILRPGVARYLARKKRRELLSTFSERDTIASIREILESTLGPDRVHIAFVTSEGAVNLGEEEAAVPKRKFMSLLDETEMRFVLGGDKVTTQALGTLWPDAQSLMAAAVPGEDGCNAGYLVLESGAPHFFEEWWAEALEECAETIGLAMEIASTVRSIGEEQVRLYREMRHAITTHSQTISGHAKSLLDAEICSKSFRRKISIIERNAEAIEATIETMKSAARTGPKLSKEPISFKDLAVEAADALSPKLEGNDIVLEGIKSLPDDQVQGDRLWLSYVIQCLLQNAVEAVEEARRQDINYGGDPGKVEIAGALHSGWLRVQIRDNGIGFDPKDKDLLFTPFYTTKSGRTGPDSLRKTDRSSFERMPDLGVDRVRSLLNTMSSRADQLDTRALASKTSLDLSIQDRPEGITIRVSDAADPGAELTSKTFHPLMQSLTLKEKHGLGLFTARRVIGELGGVIQAHSEGYLRGAVFTIELPLARA